MASFTIRLEDDLADHLKAVANDGGTSRNQLIADILAEATNYGGPPMVEGWISVDRLGEIDEDCPECGQPIHDPHIGRLSNCTWTPIVCGACAATTE